MEKIQIDEDAFADSQILSKMWLCEEYDKILGSYCPKIWIYGGWCGILPLMMFSRGTMIREMRMFDIDAQAVDTANRIMKAWKKDWKFHAEVRDVTMIDDFTDVNVIINTSTEHMDDEWFRRIPKNTVVILQSTNQYDEDHNNRCDTLEEMIEKFPLTTLRFKGEKEFVYPDRVFKRFMLIGIT